LLSILGKTSFAGHEFWLIHMIDTECHDVLRFQDIGFLSFATTEEFGSIPANVSFSRREISQILLRSLADLISRGTNVHAPVAY